MLLETFQPIVGHLLTDGYLVDSVPVVALAKVLHPKAVGLFDLLSDPLEVAVVDALYLSITHVHEVWLLALQGRRRLVLTSGSVS